MSILIRQAGILNVATASNVPTQSIDFESGSSQYLSISDANFGAYDRAKWAVSTWVKKESTGMNQGIMSQDGGAGQRAFSLIWTSTDALNIRTYQDGSAVAGQLVTTATWADTNYHHILFWYDSANATAGDRMRLWVDGTEIAAFGTDTNPTAAIFDSTAAVAVGAQQATGSLPADGLFYQHAFFSGTLPTIGQVYNAGAPRDITGLTGLYSYLGVEGGSVVADGVLVADWTNNNTAVASSTIP
jgi:hypothetical protein